MIDNAIRFMHTVDRRLNVDSEQSNKYIRFLFRHDVFCKLFKGKDNLYERILTLSIFRQDWMGY